MPQPHALAMILALQVPASTSAPEPATPPKHASCFEVVRTWTGNELDHLGIGVCTLGDVDGDGVPDFVLGTMQGAYTFAFGPGSARVVSGRTGKLLYQVRGTNKEGDCGDAYGDTIAAIGDINHDGVCDFAVGAWRYEEYRGYVTVYSGKTGDPLATIYGGPSVVKGKGPVPPEHCGFFNGAALGGSIVATGDLDGDSVPDFAVGGQMAIEASYLVSGASLSIVGALPGRPITATGDFDGDGHRDILTWSGRPGELVIVSGTTLRPLASIAIDKLYTTCVPIGDVDGDGFVDLLATSTMSNEQPKDRRAAPIDLLTGKTGKVLRSMTLDAPPGVIDVRFGALGDTDGDGVADFYVHTQIYQTGSVLWLVSGKSGRVLVREKSESTTWGREIVSAGRAPDDSRTRFLLTEYESQRGARCGGAVHLVSLRSFAK
jgi:hypothetical protein